MKSLSLFSLAVLLIFTTINFTSCKKETDENEKQALIPLKTGNKWNYKSYQGGNENSVSIEIGDFVKIEGYEGYKFLTGTRPHGSTFLVNNDDEGNFISIGGYSDVDSLFSPSTNYKLNAVKGESWDYENVFVDYDSGIFDKRQVKVYCIKTDTLITTPKGSFNCALYEYSPNSGEDVFRNYVSANIGLVKSEHYEDGNLFSYMVLSSYQLK